MRSRRGEYTKGKLAPERVDQLGVVPGWSWDPLADAWEAGLRLLHEYVAEFDCLPPATAVYRGVKLGVWVTNRRAERTKGKLAPERVAQLEAVLGWSWDPVADAWEVGLHLLREYVAEFGRLPPDSTEYRGAKLGNWVRSRLRERTKGKLAPERVAQLEAVSGWQWRVQ